MVFRTKHLCDFTRLGLLLVGGIWATLATPLTAAAQDTVEPANNTVWSTLISNPNPNQFDTPEIIQALFTPHSDLVLLSAHRGIHALATRQQASGVSENSLESIGLAAQGGWEIIELDIKMTSDGVPILSHDITWGREWCGLGTLGNTPYDPWTAPGNSSNDGKNPLISATKLSDTRSFLGNTVLRDAVSLTSTLGAHGCNGFNQLFGEYPPTLSDAFDYITRNKIRMVVFLDIDDPAVAKASWAIVQNKKDDQGRPFTGSVIFKMPANKFPNGISDFNATFGNNASAAYFIPVFNTSDVAAKTTAITDEEGGGFDVSDFGANGMGGEAGIQSWINAFEKAHFNTPAVEIGLKESGGILTQTLAYAKKDATGAAKTVGEFSPIGDYFANNNPSTTPLFFRKKNGTCCDPLSQYLYNNPNGTGPIDSSQPVDHADNRSDLFLLTETAGVNYIITDDPQTTATYLQSAAKRDICYMQKDQIAGCNTGGVYAACGTSGTGGCTSPNGSDGGDTASDLAGGPCEYGHGACAAVDTTNCATGMTCVGKDNALALLPKQYPVLSASAPPKPAQRVAYYTSWSVYGNAFYPKALDAQGIAGKLTTINYAFENIDPVNLTCLAANQPAGTNMSSPTNYDGASDAYADYQLAYTASNSVDGSTDTWGQPLEGNFNQLKKLKAKYPNLKVLLTIGGWTYSKFFSDVAATTASRQKFVSSCINLYIKGNLPILSTSPAGGTGVAAGIFDGFDIDWEFPASPNGNVGNHYSAADTANYTALLAEFRSELNALGSTKHYMLTAAVPAGPTEIQTVQIASIAQYLDYADLMAYDYHGAFETAGPTNLQAPTFDAPASPGYGTKFTVDDSVTSWLNNGFPASKLNLGLAFYGRGWSGVPNDAGHGLYRSVTGATASFPFSQQAGVVDYKELETAGKLTSANIFFDQTTDTSWVYDGGNFYGIDTPFSIKHKLAYVGLKGLGGVMMYSLEDDDATSTLVNAATGSN